MKIIQLATLLLFLAVQPILLSNVRAPFIQSGLSSHLKNAQQNIELTGEELRIIYPRLEIDKSYIEDFKLAIEVRYHISNTAEKEVYLPLEFLGTSVEAVEVYLDNDKVETNQILKSEQYEEFLHKLQTNNNHLTEKQNEEFSFIFRWGKKNFSQTLFKLNVPSGEHTLIIRYLQPMLVNENKSGYFKKFFYDKATFGLLYLVYPIKSWKIAKNFYCTLTVVVPRPMKRFFFIKTQKETSIMSNIHFKKSYSDMLKIDTYRAELNQESLPDILYMTMKIEK